MGTASTKSRVRNRKRARKQSQTKGAASPSPSSSSSRVQKEREPETVGPQFERASELPAWLWPVAAALILTVATVLRLYDYGLKPFHHDEGVNGFFLVNLVRNNVYNYDPSNYHGPTLYYFALLSKLFFGLNDFALRFVTALFGVATVWLILPLRRYIGTVGALTAAALLALSPGAVFYSRYFIHEALFVFFSVAMVVAALRFSEEKWPAETKLSDGLIGLLASVALVPLALYAARAPEFLTRELGPLNVTYKAALIIVIFVLMSIALVSLRRFAGPKATYLVYVFAAAALLFATKETAMITVGVLLIALFSTWLYMRMRGRAYDPHRRSAESKRAAKAKQDQPSEEPEAARTHLDSQVFWAVLLLSALAVFIFIHVLFYSSFFTNPKGVADSIATFKIWVRTGTSEFHKKPYETYLYWLWQEEGALLLLGAGGAIVAAWRATNRFAVFGALWALGIIMAYSLVPYKTPWLVLSFIPPLAIMGGYGVNALWQWEAGGRMRAFALGLVFVALAIGAYQTVQLNFYHYDNEQYPYVYAHTQRSYLALVDEINQAAQRAGTKEKTTISIAAPEYWPMPWYLRDFKGVAYPGRVGVHNEQIVVCGETQQAAECASALAGRYRRVGAYALRGGVTLILYERNDVPAG